MSRIFIGPQETTNFNTYSIQSGNKGKKDLTFETNPGTEGSIGSYQNSLFNPDSHKTFELRRAAENLNNPAISSQLLLIDRLLKNFINSENARKDLPPVKAAELEDGSVIVEWILGEQRIGFNLEPRALDSGWFVVNRNPSSMVAASGEIFSSSVSNWLPYFSNALEAYG